MWQKAMDLAVEVLRLASLFPKHELYAPGSQLRRASASVPANIAEGKARSSAKDYAQFLAIARGSLAETETFLALAVRLDYVSAEDCRLAADHIDQVGRTINTIRSKLLSE